ncbi:MAG: DUF2933 domain-containing protein [Proteobacteria bacterium]|nr:DUF2933 domain-containing protein [Pseudomonadota bacterium]
MICNKRTMIRSGIGLAAVVVIAYTTLPQFRNIILGLTPFLLFLLCPLSMFFMMKGMGHTKNHSQGSKEQALNQEANPGEKIDPVSQHLLPADTFISSIYHNRAYYFENRENRDAFENDPEKYLTEASLIGQRMETSGTSTQHSKQGRGCC